MHSDKNTLKLQRQRKRLSGSKTDMEIVNRIDDDSVNHEAMDSEPLFHPSFRQVFDVAADGMCIIDTNFNIVRISDLLQSSLQLQALHPSPQKCYDLIGGPECHSSKCPLTTIKNNNQPVTLEVIRGFGEGKSYILSGSPLHSSDGTVIGIIEHFKDVTELIGTQEQLQDKVEKLQVEQRRVVQQNAALNELLGKLENGRKEVTNQVRDNLEHMVFPLLETIRDHVDPAKHNLISLLISCMKDIIEPYGGIVRSGNTCLSTAESEICSMIKSGFTTKQIADLRCVSSATVIDQRKTIRKKLGIAKTDTNLSTYLKSLEHPVSN